MTGKDLTSHDASNDASHDFDEALISGYVDGELTQGDRQRVRLHLEGCAQCRETADHLQLLQQAAMTTAFELPKDTQWDETPRNELSRFLQYLGWALAAVWAIGLASFLIWQATSGDGSTEPNDLIAGLFSLAPLTAFGLIVGSALIDRAKTRKTDPYRKVQK